MQDDVQIVSEKDAGYMVSEFASGTLTAYTLRCGNEYVSCDEVLILEEDEETLGWTFEEWKEAALRGEEGYAYWIA